MDKKIEEMLREEIGRRIEALPTLQSGSEEELKAVRSIAELYRLKIAEDEAITDAEDKSEKRREDALNSEHKRKLDEAAFERDAKNMEQQKAELAKDRYIKIGIATAELIVPLVFYAAWMKKGFEFEKDGTFTSTTFRGLFNRFRPSK